MGEMEGKLEELDAKIERLQTRKRKLQAEAKQRSRKEETRRKILLGSMLLEQMKHPNWRDAIKPLMEAHLTREGDRKLFSEEWWERRFPG